MEATVIIVAYDCNHYLNIRICNTDTSQKPALCKGVLYKHPDQHQMFNMSVSMGVIKNQASHCLTTDWILARMRHIPITMCQNTVASLMRSPMKHHRYAFVRKRKTER